MPTTFFAWPSRRQMTYPPTEETYAAPVGCQINAVKFATVLADVAKLAHQTAPGAAKTQHESGTS